MSISGWEGRCEGRGEGGDIVFSGLRIKWGEVVQGQMKWRWGAGRQGSERRGMRAPEGRGGYSEQGDGDLRVEVVTVSWVMGI